eukprot:g14182.t1
MPKKRKKCKRMQEAEARQLAEAATRTSPASCSTPVISSSSTSSSKYFRAFPEALRFFTSEGKQRKGGLLFTPKVENKQYQSTTSPTSPPPQHQSPEPFRELCQSVFENLPRQAYWKPRDVPAENVFEALADQIYDLHTPVVEKNQNTKKKLGGAEWWVQVRDVSTTDANLGFHWDLDYGTGETPAWATVTYLDGLGAPTVVLDLARKDVVSAMDPEKTRSFTIPSGVVSHPAAGKHLAFRGDLLHGVATQYGIASTLYSPRSKADHDHNKRVTFLVNLWPGKDHVSDIRRFGEDDLRTQDEPSLPPRTDEAIGAPPEAKRRRTRAEADGDRHRPDHDHLRHQQGPRSKQLEHSMLHSEIFKDTTGSLVRFEVAESETAASKVETASSSVVSTDANTPVCGVSFDNGEEEKYLLYLPVAAERGLSSGKTTELKFPGRGQQAPCRVMRLPEEEAGGPEAAREPVGSSRKRKRKGAASGKK